MVRFFYTSTETNYCLITVTRLKLRAQRHGESSQPVFNISAWFGRGGGGGGA